MIKAALFYVFWLIHFNFLISASSGVADYYDYFDFIQFYQKDQRTAIEGLMFVGVCFMGLLLPLVTIPTRKLIDSGNIERRKFYPSNSLVITTVILGVPTTTYALYLLFQSDMNYTQMTLMRESSGFLIEARLFFLIPLSYILINTPINYFRSNKALISLLLFVVVYILVMVGFQARSIVLEVLSIFFFRYLIYVKDRLSAAVVAFAIASVPLFNLFVYFRLQGYATWSDFMSNAFRFEYTVLINNILVEAISRGPQFEFTFANKIATIIPSPLRNAIGIQITENPLLLETSHAALSFGGGFSLLGQFYLDFGWYSFLIFLILGTLLRVTLINLYATSTRGFDRAIAPLIFVIIVISIRNDSGAMFKWLLQTWIVAYTFNYIISPERRVTAFRRFSST